jgi:hypothetical protein
MQNCKHLLCSLSIVMCAFTGIAQTNSNSNKTGPQKIVQATVTQLNTKTP